MWILTCLLISSLGISLSLFTSNIRIDPFMIKSRIVPDVVSKAPSTYLRIKYAEDVIVSLGNVLTPSQVKYPPSIIYTSEPKTLYTICLIDPDAPSSKNHTQCGWQHWLVGNVPGYSLQHGDVISAYIGPGPSQGSGLHRYVFLLYKQPRRLIFREKHLSNRTCAYRGKFSIEEFAARYGLGTPLGGNYFLSEYDRHVQTVK